MEDSQEEKCKGLYLPWSGQETKTLLRLLVDAVNQNWCDVNGSFNKLTVEQRILPALSKECGTKKTYNNYKNRMKILKNRYKSFTDLLSYSSGFGWDPVTKKFTASQEVWDEYLKVRDLFSFKIQFFLIHMFTSYIYMITFVLFHNKDIRKIKNSVMIHLKTLRT